MLISEKEKVFKFVSKISTLKSGEKKEYKPKICTRKEIMKIRDEISKIKRWTKSKKKKKKMESNILKYQ